MTTVNVRVDLDAVQAMFTTFGQIGQFGQRSTQAGRVLAIAYAPERTGRLKASIRAGAPSAGTKILKYTITVYSNAEHAAWVEDGTAGGRLGRIFPTSHKWLAVGKREGKKPVYRLSVSGQDGQHYMKRGVRDALAIEGIAVNFITF